MLAIVDPHAGYLTQRFVDSLSTTMTIWPYQTGLSFPERAGRYIWSGEGWSPLELNLLRFRSLELLAIRRLNGRTYEVVELPAEDLSRLLQRSWDLRDDRELIFELVDTDTYERLTIKCRRVNSRELREQEEAARTDAKREAGGR